MCVAAYLASDAKITKVPSWDGRTPAFILTQVPQYDSVRDKLTGKYVYHIESPYGKWPCSCGLFEKHGRPTRADHPIQRNYYALASIVRDVLQKGGGAQVFVCWEGDQNEPPDSRIQLDPSTLEAAAFEFTERQLVEVVAHSNAERSQIESVPDRPEFKVSWGPWIFWGVVAAVVAMALGFYWAVLLGGILLLLRTLSLLKFGRPRTASWQTELMLCAAEGTLARARELIDRGADVHARNASGETALMFAAREGRYDLVEYLLSVGADPLARGDTGSCALDIAQSHGHTKVAALLQSAINL